MKKGICAAYIRKERRKSLLIGPAALLGGTVFFWLEWVTGVLKDVRMLPLALPVFLFCLAAGVYLTARGLLMLVCPERSDLCTFIRAELSEAERAISRRAMLELVEKDMEHAAGFADGKILIGQEWLFVTDSPWKPVLRLKNLRNIKARRMKNGKVILKFMDRNNGGPATREISPSEAGAILACLNWSGKASGL